MATFVDCAGYLPEDIIKFKDVPLTFIMFQDEKFQYKGILDNTEIYVSFLQEEGDVFHPIETLKENSYSEFYITLTEK